MDSSEVKCGLLNVPVDKQGNGYLVLIDNMLIEPCDYQDFLLSDPMGVDKVLFSHESGAISARLLTGKLMRLPGGIKPPPVIAIYTKSGNFRNGYDPSIASYSPKGYDLSKEFYTPKYEVNEEPQIADLRSTVYWNPAVLTSSGGRTRVSYFNGDQLGKYRVTIEGITSRGFLGRKVFRYEVVPGLSE